MWSWLTNRSVAAPLTGAVALLGLSACGAYVATGTAGMADPLPGWHQSDPGKIALIEGDPVRPYQPLGEVWARVIRPGTAGQDDDPGQELRDGLRAEAARHGADAVVMIRYGRDTLEAAWPVTLDASGLAIRYVVSP